MGPGNYYFFPPASVEKADSKPGGVEQTELHQAGVQTQIVVPGWKSVTKYLRHPGEYPRVWLPLPHFPSLPPAAHDWISNTISSRSQYFGLAVRTVWEQALESLWSQESWLWRFSRLLSCLLRKPAACASCILVPSPEQWARSRKKWGRLWGTCGGENPWWQELWSLIF